MRKKIAILLLASILIQACSRQMTPYQASQRGGMKCGKGRSLK